METGFANTPEFGRVTIKLWDSGWTPSKPNVVRAYFQSDKLGNMGWVDLNTGAYDDQRDLLKVLAWAGGGCYLNADGTPNIDMLNCFI